MKFKICILGAAMLAAAFAQTSGTISGTITDDSGAVVANAKVVAASAVTGERREATSSASGQYSFPFLAPGGYRIEVTLAGLR